MRGNSIRFFYEMVVIFLFSVMLVFVIGFFDMRINSFAVSSDIGVEFEINDMTDNFVNDSINDSSLNDDTFLPEIVGGDNVYVDNEVNDEAGFENSFNFLLWGLTIGCVVFIFVILIVVFFIFRNRENKDVVKGDGVVPEIAKKVISSVVKSSKIVNKPIINNNISTTKKAIVSSNVVISKKVPVSVQSVCVSNKLVKPVGVLLNQKRVVGGVSSLEFIKNYSFSFSKNPKERIRYFLNNGNQFILKKNLVGARQLYLWIKNEYKKLKRHDERLYREIIDFKRLLG